MIASRSLAKHHGKTAAVSDLSLDVTTSVVTGFLGPHGSGKSDTSRMIMGLDNPSSGTTLVNGRRYRELRWPLREVGALLDAKASHPARNANDHLLTLTATKDIHRPRIDEVLDIVGLTSVGHNRTGKYSLGMGQRLGIAGALLGDPGVLLFDEPVDGLDPEGTRWVRHLRRDPMSVPEALGVFGVLVATGEYGTGTIRSSLAAPCRPLLLAGKIFVVGAVARMVGEAVIFASFFIGQAVVSAGGAPTGTLVQPGELRAVALCGSFLALLGLLGLGLGVVIRHTSGATAAYVGVTSLIPLLLQRLPGNPGRFTPVELPANSVSAVETQPGWASAPEGMLAMVLYCTVVLGSAAALIAARDA